MPRWTHEPGPSNPAGEPEAARSANPGRLSPGAIFRRHQPAGGWCGRFKSRTRLARRFGTEAAAARSWIRARLYSARTARRRRSRDTAGAAGTRLHVLVDAQGSLPACRLASDRPQAEVKGFHPLLRAGGPEPRCRQPAPPHRGTRHRLAEAGPPRCHALRERRQPARDRHRGIPSPRAGLSMFPSTCRRRPPGKRGPGCWPQAVQWFSLPSSQPDRPSSQPGGFH